MKQKFLVGLCMMIAMINSQSNAASIDPIKVDSCEPSYISSISGEITDHVILKTSEAMEKSLGCKLGVAVKDRNSSFVAYNVRTLNNEHLVHIGAESRLNPDYQYVANIVLQCDANAKQLVILSSHLSTYGLKANHSCGYSLGN